MNVSQKCRTCGAWAAFVLIIGAVNQGRGQIFAPPTGGWAYVFEGDGAVAGDEPFTSLDGTWDHDNGSDEWDGTGIGEGNPGGVSALVEEGTTYLRVQDTGDPRDYGMPDPGSNRKQYFTHQLASDFTDETRPDNLDTIIDDGVTLYFRARVATPGSGPLDPLHPDGGSSPSDWPADGLGYFQHDGGKSLVAMKQPGNGGPNIAFGLARGENVNADLFEGQGLILPHLLQNPILLSNDSDPANTPADLAIDTGQIVPVDDITQWQEFWITVQAGFVGQFEDGSHLVDVYYASADDPLTPVSFGINGATGSDFGGGGEETSYLALGAGATPRNGAFDLDFLAWAPGLHVPELAPETPTGDFNLDGVVDLQDMDLLGSEIAAGTNDVAFDLNADALVNQDDRDVFLGGDLITDGNKPLADADFDGTVGFSDFVVLSNQWEQTGMVYSQGDFDTDGQVQFGDFVILSNNWQASAAAQAAAVPEPAGMTLLLAGCLTLVLRRRRRT